MCSPHGSAQCHHDVPKILQVENHLGFLGSCYIVLSAVRPGAAAAAAAAAADESAVGAARHGAAPVLSFIKFYFSPNALVAGCRDLSICSVSMLSFERLINVIPGLMLGFSYRWD